MNADRPDPHRPEEPDPGLDVDAAFAEIVAHFGPPSEDVGDDPATPDPGDAEQPGPPADEPDGAGRTDPGDLRDLFRPAWGDSLDGPASWEDEGHFVPPPPPPLPPVDPRRRIAWGCLFGSPTVTLVLLVFGVTAPRWLALALALAFVGGFGYLVATMSTRGHDWPGDDGAVL